MTGRIHARQARLQDLQRVSVGYQQDVTTAVPPLQLRDERRRPVQHSGCRLNLAVSAAGIRLVACPDACVVDGRRPFPVPEAPFAEGFGDGDVRRAKVCAHHLCRLPGAGEAG
jgi:hypothetical protein